jgi:hypothetical protein
VSPLRLPGVSQLLAVARLPIHAAPASASVTSGNFHATTTEASVFARSVCSVMWGSAQADRSINASGSLPRTPSPAFGLGPRLFRASHRVSSEPRRPAPVPPGPPDPRSGHRHRGRRDGLRTDRPTPTGTRRRSSSEPRPPVPPRIRTSPGSSEPGCSHPAPTAHSTEAGPAALRNGGRPPRGTRRRSSSEPRPPPSPDPASRFFGIGASSAGIGITPFGARSPLPRLVSVVRPPHQRGSRSVRSPVSAGAPHRAGRQRQEGNGRSDAFPAADEGNSSEGARRTAGTDPCTRPPSGDPLQARTKRGEPSAGCGVQQTRNSYAEKAVEVVRNHEGGTGTGTWRRRSDESLPSGLLSGVDACEVHRRQGPQSHERRSQRKTAPALHRAL